MELPSTLSARCDAGNANHPDMSEANQRDLVDIRVNDDQFHGLRVLSWP